MHLLKEPQNNKQQNQQTKNTPPRKYHKQNKNKQTRKIEMNQNLEI